MPGQEGDLKSDFSKKSGREILTVFFDKNRTIPVFCRYMTIYRYRRRKKWSGTAGKSQKVAGILKTRKFPRKIHVFPGEKKNPTFFGPKNGPANRQNPVLWGFKGPFLAKSVPKPDI